MSEKWSVLKRNGDIVDFDQRKIIEALYKCNPKINADSITKHATDKIYGNGNPISVNNIQDFIESSMIQLGYIDEAKKWIRYRDYKDEIRETILSQEEVDKIEDDNKYFANELARLTFVRTYPRFDQEKGRRETWTEAVNRVITFYKTKTIGKIDDSILEEVRQAILVGNNLPSMRCMSMAGPAAKRDNLCIYNCCFRDIDTLEAFSEAVYILMGGSGLGFSVEQYRCADKLPRIKLQKKNQVVEAFVIPDTSEGWANALRHGLDRWFNGLDVEFDFSLLRPSGARLVTKNGFSSGSEPLKRLLKYCRDLILSLQGKRLDPIHMHDIMCMIGDVVVSGGVRRSALISLSDLNDPDMRSAKAGYYPWGGHPYRTNANNSVVYEETPDAIEFMDEWISLAKSGSGERGIFNRQSAIKNRPKRRKARLFGLNPCQPTWAPLLNQSGIVTMGAAVIGETIWSEDGWVKITNKVLTGNKEVFKYETTAGTFYGTENHRVVSRGVKIEAKDSDSIDVLAGQVGSLDSILMPQDTMDGLVFGDGSVHKASNDLVYLCVGEDDKDYINSEITHLMLKHRPGLSEYAFEISTTIQPNEIPKTYERRVPSRFIYGTSGKRLAFLRGVYSANGSIVGNRVSLKSASKGLIEDVQLILSSLGIRSYYTTNRSKDVEFENGTYTCKENYDLNISGDREKFASAIGFIQKYKTKKLEDLIKQCSLINSKGFKKTFDIVSVESMGIHPVYDITVDGPNHTYWTGGLNVSNCSEIVLRPDGGVCNLSMLIARADDTWETLKEKVRIATIIGTIQSTFIDFKYVNENWIKNAEEERLLGVSIAGQMDCPLFTQFFAGVDISKNLQDLRDYAIEVNKEFAEYLGINQSVAVTTVKPDGTGALVVDSSSGVHVRYSRYYIRRVRVTVTDPLFLLARDSGVPWHPETGQKAETMNTAVLEFPIKAPEGCLTRNSLTAMQQLEYWLCVKKNWSEHSVSCTVYVEDHEWLEVGAWVHKNFDQISGLSFLPKDNHVYQLAPYEEISEETYNKLSSRFPKINYAKLRNYERTAKTEGGTEKSCYAGQCDL